LGDNIIIFRSLFTIFSLVLILIIVIRIFWLKKIPLAFSLIIHFPNFILLLNEYIIIKFQKSFCINVLEKIAKNININNKKEKKENKGYR
jgi:hypothetical protein